MQLELCRDLCRRTRCAAENNGDTVELEDAAQVERLAFPALVGLEEHPRAMYFCFDRSPHAMPLSIFFDVAGRVKLEDKLRFEAWTGQRFEPVRTVDLTRNLLHPGTMLLYLSRPLPERTLFGVRGYWLRLSRSSYLDNRRRLALGQRGPAEHCGGGPAGAGRGGALLHRGL